MVNIETTTLESNGPPGSLLVKFGYVLVRSKFSEYIHVLHCITFCKPLKIWYSLNRSRKKSFIIYLVLLSLPLQRCTFGLHAKRRRHEFVGIETLVKLYSPAWQFCTTGITSYCRRIHAGTGRGQEPGNEDGQWAGSFHDKTLGRRK